jgi:hypothetical protein
MNGRTLARIQRETDEMAKVHVLDNYYLAITLLVTIVYQLFFFAIAFAFKFDKLTSNLLGV